MWEISLISNHAVLNFKFCRCGSHVDDLVRYLHELVEVERAIVERARQAKAVIYEHSFARAIAFIHAADLRNGCVRFVDHYQQIFWEKVDDRIGLRTGRTSRQVTRIILNAVAEAHFLQHFKIVFSAHPQPLRFEKLILRLEFNDALLELFADRA